MNRRLKISFCPYCAREVVYRELEGLPRAYCETCDIVLYENPVPAVSIVLLKADQVLLVKRAVEPQRGKWCLPGGFVEVNEAPVQTLKRELEEETNLHPREFELIGVLTSRENECYKNVLLIGYFVSAFTGKLMAGDDATDAKFFPLDNRPPLAFKGHENFLKIINDKQRKE